MPMKKGPATTASKCSAAAGKGEVWLPLNGMPTRHFGISNDKDSDGRSGDSDDGRWGSFARRGASTAPGASAARGSQIVANERH